MKILIALMAVFTLVFVVSAQNEVCNLPKEQGVCRAHMPMHYYNAEKKMCEEFVYSGCMGNGNRFETLSLCEAACLQSS